MIDHTLLKVDATQAEIHKLAEEAKEYSFASICVIRKGLLREQ
jgi:deoxyribose-phosphate aldolase